MKAIGLKKLCRAASAGLVIFCLSGALFAPASAAGNTVAAPYRALQTEVTRLSGAIHGTVGVAIREVGARNTVSLHAGETFPMASTYKIAIAGRLLSLVDKGELSLDKMIDVRMDQRVEFDVIADNLVHPGVSLSVANLIELMLTQSDNTATDVLFELAGGGAAVTDWVRGQNIDEFRVDRGTADIIRDFFGMPPGPYMEASKAALAANPHLWDASGLPNLAFESDPRDQATPPLAMAALLERILSGKALSPSSTEFVLGVMKRCRTGQARLLGLMPEGTVLAHKTGTIGGTANDVGILDLPDGRKLLIVVFIKASDNSYAERDRVIAEIARTARDYYLALGKH